VFLGLLGTVATAATPAGLVPELRVETLPNGLTVVIEEQHRTADVALHLEYTVGSADEAPGQHGAAHLFEHLMFERSEHVPQGAFDSWLTEAGGQNNAWTSSDSTAFHMRVPVGAFELGLFLESDRMGFLDAGLDYRNVRNQQDVVLQERAEDYSAPHGLDFDVLTGLVFPEGHPYHQPVIGRISDVRGFGQDEAASFWRHWYGPENAVLVVVGHVDADAALDRVRHWFSDVPARGADLDRSAPPELATVRQDGLLLSPVSDWTLYLAWPSPPELHPDEAALELLTYVLSWGRGTRLDDALYFDRRLATDCNAWLSPGMLGGMFVVEATLPRGRLARAERRMEWVLAEVRARPPAAWELERARQAVRSDLLDQLESIEARAGWWATCTRLTGTPDCLDEVWARYAAVGVEDLVRVAETWLVPERRTSLSVVPEGYGGGLPGAVRVELPE